MALFSEEVTRKDGSVVTVTALNKEDLVAAVKVAKEDVPAETVDINVPEKKSK